MTESTDGLFSFLDDDALVIPGVKSREHPDGKSYTIPSPDADTGARFAALAEIAMKVHRGVDVSESDLRRLRMDDDEEREFMEQVLGDALAELKADGVSWRRLQMLTQYAYIYFAYGPEQAAAASQNGLISSGKATAPNRAARRATGGGQSARQDSTASRRRRRR